MSKKILSLLLISFLLVSANTVTKTFTFTSSPKVERGYCYLDGCRPSMEGFAPAVAVKGSKIFLGPNLKAKSATVTYEDLVLVQKDVFIEPTVPAFNSKNATLKLNRQNIYKDAAARELLAKYYERDALYPGTTTEVPVGTSYKFGCGIAIAVVHPVQYNPVRGELYYYQSVTVSVETEPVTAADEVAAYVMTPFHRSILQFTVDNPEALANLELTPMDATDYEVLVITYPTVKDKFDDYVALNKKRALRTKVVLIADVLSGSGATDQDKIRNYVKKEYEDNKIVFCVLGGDINAIAHRELYSESYDHNQTPDRLLQKYSGADLYYGTFDGNWNDDGDGKYGEPGEEDLLWEVYVSRMPVDNTTHLTNILNKTKHYVETPKKDQVKNILMAGEFLWDDYGKSIWGIDNMEYYIGHKNAYGWETYGWPETFDIERISDKETGAAHGWSGSDLRGKIISHKPSWIDHDGHANSTYCYTFSSSSIGTYFNNTGDNQNYWISCSGGCNPCQFKVNNCFMEVAINTATGTVGMIGNWDNGIGDDDDNNSPSGVPTRHGHDAMFNPDKRVPFLEAAHATGKEALIDVSTDPNAINIAPYYGLMRYTSYNTNLLGDPALGVWTDTPQDATASTFGVTATKDAFTMSKSRPYTCVLLANPSNDEVITGQITGYKYNADVSFVVGDSACSITDDSYKTFAASNSKVKVYVKAPNYIGTSFEVDIGGSGIINTLANKINHFSVMPVKGKLLVNFELPVNEHANVSIYNSKGALVTTLFNDINSVNGLQTVKLDKNTLSSGIYYCKLRTKNAQSVESFVVAQ